MLNLKLNLRQIVILVLGVGLIFTAALYHIISQNQLLESRISALSELRQYIYDPEAGKEKTGEINQLIIEQIEGDSSGTLISRKINTITSQIINSRKHQRLEIEFTGKYDRIFPLIKSITGISDRIYISEWSMNSTNIFRANPNIRVRMVIMVMVG